MTSCQVERADDFRWQVARHVTSAALVGPRSNSCGLRPGLRPVHDRLVQLLTGTVFNGDNCSLLLVGAQGIGKTLVVEHAMQNVLQQANTDASNPVVGVVRLCGALHNDERSAFLEVARQLCMCFNIPFTKTASCDDNMAFLSQVLRELHRAFKAVVFIIDGLEAYVRAAKQTLLYNLLDALSSSQVRAAVLAVTTCWDIQEAMEKRVRSRFSQAKLMVPGLEPSSEGNSLLAVLYAMLQLPATLQQQQQQQHLRQYNGWVTTALQDKAVQEAMLQLECLGATPRDLAQAVVGAMAVWCQSTSASCQFTSGHLLAALRSLLACWDTGVAAVEDCSKLELCLLVACFRLQEHGQPTFNFEMVFDEFSKMRQEQLGHIWRRPAAWRAFLDLGAAGLLRCHSSRPEAHGYSQCYLPVQLCITRTELQQGLDRHSSCPDFIKRWLQGEHATTMTFLA